MNIDINKVNEIKNKYRPGTRIQMVKMDDPYHPVPPGTYGTVRFVDDVGTIHTAWDNGSSLGVCLEVDRINIATFPYVPKLYRTESGSVLCYPISGITSEIPAGSVYDDEFDIIENDEDKDYGYTEFSFIEGKYRAEYYKHRLPVKYFSTYNEAVNEIRENSNYSAGDKDTLEEVINDHLDWWLSSVTAEDIGIANIPVFSLTDEEIKDLLDRGFKGERIFIRRI